MLHVLNFTDSGVLYSRRYVRTTGWYEERAEGKPLFPGMLTPGFTMDQVRLAVMNMLSLRSHDAPAWVLVS